MKLAEGYLLKDIVDCYVLIPVGQNVVDYKTMVHLNDTGYFIATQLQEDISYDDLLAKMVEQYEASEEEVDTLRNDLDEFLDVLEGKGLLVK